MLNLVYFGFGNDSLIMACLKTGQSNRSNHCGTN